ncbi:hypothetical protein AC578_8674 [Pseudocercospora eumusae]|uniref:Uncharacterized protein n=1 Tax=Pseudocercospora eumusae TaxID=321146 RepID=A0A139HQ72_9PEZI|nr:hypothetical protein AC578_8674 [Pseudocercospora eumusae]
MEYIARKVESRLAKAGMAESRRGRAMSREARGITITVTEITEVSDSGMSDNNRTYQDSTKSSPCSSPVRNSSSVASSKEERWSECYASTHSCLKPSKFGFDTCSQSHVTGFDSGSAIRKVRSKLLPKSFGTISRRERYPEREPVVAVRPLWMCPGY